MVQDRNIGVLSFSMSSDESLEKFAKRIKGFEDKFGIVFIDKRLRARRLYFTGSKKMLYQPIR